MAAAKVQPWEVLVGSLPCELVKDWRDDTSISLSRIEDVVRKRNALVKGPDQVDVGYGRGDFGRATPDVLVQVHKGHVIAKYDEILRASISRFRASLVQVSQELDAVENSVPQ